MIADTGWLRPKMAEGFFTFHLSGCPIVSPLLHDNYTSNYPIMKYKLEGIFELILRKGLSALSESREHYLLNLLFHYMWHQKSFKKLNSLVKKNYTYFTVLFFFAIMVLKIIYCVVSKEEVVLVAMQLIAIFLALASRANATAAVSWIFRQKVLCNLQRFREIFACIRSRFEIQSSYFHTGLTGLIIHIM